jgi:uroporphyrinogen decarboxylase
MRQAGRYMASYRSLRQRYSFLELCHTPELMTQVTLLPIQAFELDAAILFSDILVIPEALGVGLQFEDQRGPIIEKPLRTAADVANLSTHPDMDRLRYVEQGIRSLLPHLQVPLIGFCGAPFTLASYMIEGQTSRDLKKTKQWLFQDPTSFHALLQLLADWSVAYLKLQIAAGVQAIQIFESWSHLLAEPQFQECSLVYLDYILKQLVHTDIPIILFCRGSSVFAPLLAPLQPSCISLDWNCQMAKMRQVIRSSIALQGNLDPSVLLAPVSTIKKQVDHILDSMQGDPGFIFNLGHGILPDTPEESVHFLTTYIKDKRSCPVTL